MSAGIPINQDSGHDSADEVRKATRLYLLVGLILFCGTGATVAIATVPWLDVGKHGLDQWDMLLGIGIAATKASLVAAIFMHLNHERRLVYGIATLAGIHAAGFFIGTYSHFANMSHDSYFYGNLDVPYGLSAGAPHPGHGRNSPPVDPGSDPISPPDEGHPAPPITKSESP